MKAIHICNLAQTLRQMTKSACPQIQTIKQRPFVGHLAYHSSDKPIFKLGREFDESNSYFNFEINQVMND